MVDAASYFWGDSITCEEERSEEDEPEEEHQLEGKGCRYQPIMLHQETIKM